MLRCSECGFNHYIGALFCKDCGQFLMENGSDEQPFFNLSTIESFNGFRRKTSTDTQVTPQGVEGQLVFVIPSSGRQVVIKLDKTIRIGRSDHVRYIEAELDLTEDQGIEYGVSREHALVQPGQQGANLIDLGSTNGTQLNNRRLPPNEPYPLSDGDTIRFGRLLVRVFFES